MAKPKMPSRAMLAAIGKVAAESSVVEDRLRTLFCYLIDSPYGAVIVAGDDLSSLGLSCLRVARYNLKFSDHDAEGLAGIVKAIEVARPMRNSLIHARWERISGTGAHYGVKSSRPSPRSTSTGIDDVAVWTPENAELVADGFKAISERIDRYIDETFPDRSPYVSMIDRRMWALIEVAVPEMREPPHEDAGPVAPPSQPLRVD